MQIYLPIADISVSAVLLIGMGFMVGLLSGLFGVGGGFLMTPLLLFMGIPAPVAVATEANQIVASSISGAIAHFRQRSLDLRMGIVLALGGIVGSIVGVFIFGSFKRSGQVDLFVSLVYVFFLSIIGSLMLIESVRAWRKNNSGTSQATRRGHYWVHGLPLRMRFKVSRLYISVIPPLVIGFTVGFLAAIMGIGGGFIIVPAMIYILRMPTNVVIGTSLFQIIFVTALSSVMHAYLYQTVDVILALLLLTGSTVGAQVGTYYGRFLKSEQLRVFLAIIVLGVAIKLLLGLIIEPQELYSIGKIETGGH